MESIAVAEYISAGGNRHSAASDWSTASGILAYGADQNVALWNPLDLSARGVFALLHGHKAKVNAVTFSTGQNGDEVLISGSADGEIHLWTCDGAKTWTCKTAAKAHEGAVNCVAGFRGTNNIVTGGADAKINIWRWHEGTLVPIGTIATKPRFIPLSLALGGFASVRKEDAAFMVAGGTRNDIQVYALQDLSIQTKVDHCATLKGHEGWIHSLSLKPLPEGGHLLASTSADKYIRIWKFSNGTPQVNGVAKDSDVAIYQSTLTAKVQKVSVADASYSITFEALLLGHEDWVYSARWSPQASSQQLLSASADGTLTLWEPEPSSGIWVSITRLGEISGQKGATTATGSAGGFWSAHWSPDGHAVTCLGRTGSWRMWHFDATQQYWVSLTATTGHVSAVNGISWTNDGSYLLSTGSDQTTRLHAEWRRGIKRTWHEFARPQIHGYDLNCVSSTSAHQFASGADEKLLRVFDEPQSTARMLQRLCGVESLEKVSLPQTAAIPVLGLSNKAVDEPNGLDDNTDTNQVPSSGMASETDHLEAPPTEDILARHTLWPEREKLYGHGYEISESASNGNILATACKASSLDHAVIRLYDTTTWTEIRPSLTAHTLTVTRLAWSHAARNLLLSVGRDRQWAIFQQNQEVKSWQLLQSNTKAHSRMILDAAWSPSAERTMFVTAGRDKAVKLWAATEPSTGFALVQTVPRKTAVTALSLTETGTEGLVCMAVGEDDGTVSVHLVDTARSFELSQSSNLPEELCPSKTVTRLAWRPDIIKHGEDGPGICLAVASADSSVRILRVDITALPNAKETDRSE